jgi:acyl-homoserine lactone acylase PvdQ
MRTVIEMRPEGPKALLLLTGGQSGRFNSANYHDQVPDWLEGRYHEAYLPGSFDASQYQTTIRFNRK